jgi:hypothetical protein
VSSRKTATTQPAARATRRRKPDPEPEPDLIDEHTEADEVVTVLDAEVFRVDGLAVVRDEPMPTNLSRPGKVVPSSSIRILTLEDDSQVHACADSSCEVYGSRGDVQTHRWAVHGFSKNRGKASPEEVLTTLMSMPVGQLIEMATEIADWERSFALERERWEIHRDNQRAQVSELHKQLNAANKRIRSFETTFARLGFVPKEDD